MSNIAIIAAIGEDNALGRDQKLLWHLPKDMKRFKTLTTGHPIIMGRKTFASFPRGPLPNRKNIILTTQLQVDYEGCFTCHSIEEALRLCTDQEPIFIIGGALVYKQFLTLADTIYLTKVQGKFPDADCFFPPFNLDEWEEVEKNDFLADEKNKYAYSFITYKRKK
ncbi:MAG: dihydrofolate reductase [Massilibacteroides sp.]|nr:dihydrofolate reductase [Massilibacteroides sp.]